MSESPALEELMIVMSARNHRADGLSEAFLKDNHIVPDDWALSQPPEQSPRVSRVIFTNGMRFEARPGQISITEGFRPEGRREPQVADVARRYAEADLEWVFSAVGINPRRFVLFREQAAAHDFIAKQLMQPGSWQQFGNAPLQAGLNLVYQLEKVRLRLAINEARLKFGEKTIPAIMFAGNFHYSLSKDQSDSPTHDLQSALDHWKNDTAAFQTLIEDHFLSAAPNKSA